MPLPTPPPDAASAAEPAAWAVFDGSGRKWAAYSNIGEAERCAENWNTPRVRKDYGPVQPCHVVPLYTADVPALLSRLARAESALREIREYVVKAEAACLQGEQDRAKDMLERENSGIYQMLCEQRYAWEQKAASYRALLAFIDVSSSSPAAPGTGGTA